MELCLVVDHACNLRCRYCYMGEKRAAPMSCEVMRKAVALALGKNDGWLSITLFGGEPLLRPETLRTVQQEVHEVLRAYSKPVQLRWLLDTNATLLDATIATFLAEQHNCRVFVSLDGIAAAHDTHRLDVAGQPTHARVLSGIEHVRAACEPCAFYSRCMSGCGCAQMSLLASARAIPLDSHKPRLLRSRLNVRS